MKWLAAHGAIDPKKYGRAAVRAVCDGHLHVLQWLDENGEDVIRTVIVESLLEIQMNGHSNVVTWILERAKALALDALMGRDE